ncbi:phospholipase SGR2 isoform X2 [Phoenix dactylifera]|uniref:Phospholipase SGR2 isoform X2 n=1 Tax=Phoenix dactylifera TaxID=42345 RepID=A0A8B8JB79_PHODC|nr:phospholipase SGR2 isoform X2 [Phoenix dactylifera]
MANLEKRRENEAIASVSEAASFSQVEETSPDLLKNTPSNIARLEDVIEHCKGRQKYLAQTKSPSDGEDVRWYFCKVPLAEKELAASVPQTEIVGKSDYFRFSMRDSLALEASFLQREEELLAHWWGEYAECSAGPSGPSTANMATGSRSDDLYVVEEERVGVPVKGGLYEVDLTKRHCFPVYWHGENRRVLRGHWFACKGGLDWLPLREDVAEQLELAYRCQVWHRRTYQPSGLFAARVDLQGPTQGLHALFTGVDDTWEAWLVSHNSSFTLNAGRGNGVKLRRGFSPSGSLNPTQDELRQRKEEEMDDYCSQVPVGHLVFMVHGIGQRLEKANLVDDVGDFRRITASLAERHLTPYQRSTQRVLFIPCQWRRALKLSGESAVEKITLDGVRGLRVTLSATVHDVLYYMSPIYCQDIIDSVSNQLNRLYAKFLKRNPGYNGKVSIYGHSLGSVLSYDILCHQECLCSPFPMESVYMERIPEQESVADASCQAFVSSGTMTSQNNNNNINGANLEQLACTATEGSSMSHPYIMVNEHNSQDISADVLEDSSNSSGFMYPKEESDDSVPRNITEKLDIDMLVTEEAGKEFGQHSGATFNAEERDSNASPTTGNGDYEGDAVKVAGMMSKDVIDKDKLISLLDEEVKALKVRIAELEHNLCTTSYPNSGKEVKSTIKQSSLSNLSTEEDDKRSYTPYVKYTKLDFKVDTFFAVGSPLGVFLALRNIRIGIGRGQDYWQDEKISEEMPSCRQMFNIFHPFDPVAYRVEPLICKEYISKRPVIVPYHRGGKRLHIGFQEFTEDIAARSQAIASHLNSLRVKMVNVFHSRDKDNMDEATEEVKEKERSYGSIMIERLTGSEDGRIDHVLQVFVLFVYDFFWLTMQDKTFRHPYLSALGSHTNYWRDHDTALFILKHLYRDMPEEPPATEQSSSGWRSRTQRRATKLIYDRDAMDEDTPLTFSDNLLIREFSRKAKRS